MLRRLLVIAALSLGGLLLAGPSYASPAPAAAGPDNPPSWCFQPNAQGDLPSCSWDGSRWHRDFDSTGFGDAGFGDAGFGGGVSDGPPAWFVLFAVVAVLAGIGGTLYKVSLARRMAERSGMSKGEATAVTLLTDDGLDAAYLASSLRRPDPVSPPTTSPAPRTAEERLRELQQLLDQGLMTQQEYDARRRVVLDQI